MSVSRRQQKVSSLIKEELGRLLIQEIQSTASGLITVTGVEMTADLKTAHVYLSVFGHENKEEILNILEKRKGFFRKSIASLIKLKYNPLLIFSLDPAPDYAEKIDRLIEISKKNEK